MFPQDCSEGAGHQTFLEGQARPAKMGGWEILQLESAREVYS